MVCLMIYIYIYRNDLIITILLLEKTDVLTHFTPC